MANNPKTPFNPTAFGLRVFLNESELARYDGLKRSHRRMMVKKGEYPQPVRLSPRRIVWDASEVADWQRSRVLMNA